MTKHLRIFLALILLMAVSVTKASTLCYEVDNICYAVNTDDSTAMVVASDAYKDMAEITIPATITEDGVTYHVTELGRGCFKGCASLSSITIPNSVTRLEWSCFDGCTGLTSITIPNSVTELGGSCFAGCTGLTNVTIPNSVTSLGRSCFRGCTSLTSITLPNSVTELGEYCFKGCTSLTNITIPNYVSWLGDACFRDCMSLTSITIPNSVNSLEDFCFYGCTSLTSITIPNSVTSLGYLCFGGCTGLTSITIPNSVTELEEYCFKGCKSLKEVTCLAKTPPSAYGSFEYEAQKTLYVPEASVEAYKTGFYDWRFFGKILPLSTNGIKAVSKGDIGMNLENGTLTLSNVPENEPVSVYSTTGQLLGTGKGNISVNAQGAQMVIVKVGGKSYKMLAK